VKAKMENLTQGKKKKEKKRDKGKGGRGLKF